MFRSFLKQTGQPRVYIKDTVFMLKIKETWVNLTFSISFVLSSQVQYRESDIMQGWRTEYFGAQTTKRRLNGSSILSWLIVQLSERWKSDGAFECYKVIMKVSFKILVPSIGCKEEEIVPHRLMTKMDFVADGTEGRWYWPLRMTAKSFKVKQKWALTEVTGRLDTRGIL